MTIPNPNASPQNDFSEPGEQVKVFLFGIVAGVLILGGVWGVFAFVGNDHDALWDSYFRGVWDVCVSQISPIYGEESATVCNTAIQNNYADWYDQPSPGYEAPTP